MTTPDPSSFPTGHTPPATSPSTMSLMRRLFTYAPGLFAFNVVSWAVFHSLPAAFSYFVSRIFAALSEAQLSEGAARGLMLNSAWLLVAAFALTRFARFGVFYGAVRAWFKLWITLDALLRRNLLGWLLLAPGTRRLPDTPAEAVSRFRDDVDDVGAYTEVWVDAAGFFIYSVVAIFLMWRVDSLITLVVCAPLLLVVIFVQRLSPQIRAYRRRMREATARVTDFVGETFGAVSAVKLSAQEAQMVAHMHKLGGVRQSAALKDVLLTELIKGVNTNMINLAIGAVLLLGANLILRGRMDVGDFVLFFALLPRLTGAMGYFGDMIARHRRTGVSFERMHRLLQDAPLPEIVAHHDLHLKGDSPALPAHSIQPDFQRLDVTGLMAVYENGRGLQPSDLHLERGEFVVVTGRIGSGKSTLLRALLGLIPAGGEWRWNGELVLDPAAFLVPPRSAYTAQLPQLFSDSLIENVLMEEGQPPLAAQREAALGRSLRLSVLDSDIATLPHGLSTQVGARGVKLSGGQVQRVAVARMLARNADLLVFDDVSSALDAETERQLWAGLATELPGVTCLVVSHRRAALLRADRIVLLNEGRIADQGKLSELLLRSADMRALWDEEPGTALGA